MLLFCWSFSARAQHHASWYFGNQAGIRFTSTGVVSVTNGQVNTTEGCSAISDLAGNLLIYTDGVTVFDKNHQPMPNGTGLMGHHSSAGSALIIPFPGRPHHYIILTADAGENQFYRGYRYSVVNMNLNGGNGDVTEKNLLIATGGTERLAVVKHANGKDYWLVTKDRSGNGFRSFKIDCAGVSKQSVSSFTGPSLTPSALPSPEGIGFLKASPNGAVIGMTVWDGPQKGAYLYQFNPMLGEVSNSLSLSPGDTLNSTYGIEFSPDNSKVYVSHGLNDFIRQYDLSSWNASAINASVYTIPMYRPYAMQLGPDNTIYIAKNSIAFLSRIQQPNLSGVACNFNDNAIQLLNGYCFSGLPLFPNQYAPLFDSGVLSDTTQLNGSLSLTKDICKVQLTASSNALTNVSWQWNFGDGQTDTGRTVNHIYADTGNYLIELTIYWTRPCRFDSLKLSQQVQIHYPLHQDFMPVGHCAKETIQFNNLSTDSTSSVQQWIWDFGDGSNMTGFHASHQYQQAGSYPVSLQAVYANGCSVSYTQNLALTQAHAHAGSDTTVQEGSVIPLQGSGGIQYLWTPATGLNDATIANPMASIPYSINYVLMVTDANGCKDTDTLHIKTYPFPEIYVPQAFTPNGDGKNDRLKPLGMGIRELNYFRVYNRWGQLVFESRSLQEGWDGSIQGQTQSSGAYVWLLEAIDNNGRKISRKGSVVLIR